MAILTLFLLIFSTFTQGQENFPEVPAILRDMSMVQTDASGNYFFTRPQIPPHRTTADGRVALGIKHLDNTLKFALFAPESLRKQFTLSAANTSIIQSPYSVARKNFFDVADVNKNFAPGGSISHRSICDVASDFPTSSDKSNPYPCTNNSNHDCYDFTVIANYFGKDAATNSIEQSQLWGTPVTVEVANPKTANAKIVSISTKPPVGGKILYHRNFFEPMTTTDGRLLVGRIDHSELSWKKSDATTVRGNYDIVYSVAPLNSSPCDVTQWNEFYPITHAPYDAKVKRTYPFAFTPFRDAENNFIGDGVEFGGTYPWIDRLGRNLFFSSFGNTLYRPFDSGVAPAFPTLCVPGFSCNLTPSKVGDVENGGNTRGISVMGAWTSGKMVLLDGILNSTDFGLKTSPENQRMTRLYKQVSSSEISDPSWVRIGAGRDNEIFTSPEKLLNGAFNTTLIESMENLFMANPNMKPVTYRDVVWLMSNGKASQEVVFDDFLDPNVLIYSEMNASLLWKGASFHYQNGGSANAPLHLQNAATSINHPIPPYGLVRGSARIEPVALGGIQGRGLWLNGSNAFVEYPLRNQSTTTPNLFLSIFVDPRRSKPTGAQRLVTFPNQSAITVTPYKVNYLNVSGQTVHSFSLPWTLRNGRWENLAMSYSTRPSPNQPLKWIQTIRFYVRGMPIDEWQWEESGPTKLFDLASGGLLVGGSPSGLDNFRGWIDEFKLLSYVPPPEMICNHARGTLLSADPTYQGGLATLAKKYPSWTQSELQKLLGDPPGNFYACGTAWMKNDLGYATGYPKAIRFLRTRLTMGSHPLVFNQPRPNFSKNKFCLSCHVDQASRIPALRESALHFRPAILMQNDPRRQPLQPPRLIFGNIPAKLFPGGLPATDQIAPSNGALEDEWLFP